jgi:hypothetical protein
MRRPLAFATVLAALLALPSTALANPGISVSSARDGSTAKLPAKATHTLRLTAGAAPEELTVSVVPWSRITVTGAESVERPPGGTGPQLAVCPGRWSNMREPFDQALPFQAEVSLTIAPGQTATLTAGVTLREAPWPDESLDAVWSIEPAQGQAFDVMSSGPAYSGPSGVELTFRVIRAPDGHYVFAGTTDPEDLNSGRVEIWGFPPARRSAKVRAIRIARVPVRNGKWTFTRFAPDRRGEWEFYARYRTARRAYANAASAPCGTTVQVH